MLLGGGLGKLVGSVRGGRVVESRLGKLVERVRATEPVPLRIRLWTGRSYELGLASRHYLRHFPLRLPGMSPMGLGLLATHRLRFRPHRIEGIDQLRAILERAKALERAE